MFSVSEHSALRTGILKASGATDPKWFFEERGSGASALPAVVSDEPTRLSLGTVASLQSPLPFHLALA